MSQLHLNYSGFSRRSFLRLSAMTTAAVALPKVVHALRDDKKSKRPLGPQEFKKNLAGPILSLPTTFNEDLTVNHDAVHQMIGRAIRFGVPIFELTAGNSKYVCLEFDEIKAVTRSMIEAADGKGITIAATAHGPPRKSSITRSFASRMAPMPCKSCCRKVSRMRTSSTNIS